jgi:hypothetical protein
MALTIHGLQDDEVLEMLAPADEIEEEKRLQAEREAAAVGAGADAVAAGDGGAMSASAKPTVGTALDSGRFAALEQLLRQSQAYTEFLAEQMKASGGIVGAVVNVIPAYSWLH